MDKPRKVSRWRRIALRLLAFAVVGGGVLLGWFLFFPVPLGWVARLGISRALPSSGPLHVGVEGVTFRWRWGQPAISLEVRGIDATAGGRPLATVREVAVEIPKAGLRQKHFAPSLISISDPHVTADQTKDGALTLLLPPAPSSAPLKTPVAAPSPAGPPDLTPFGIVLPAPGTSSRLVVEGFTVHLRSTLGEAHLPFGRIETTLAQTAGGTLQLELALPLTAAASPPRLTVHAALETRTGRGDFAVKLPLFATADLPKLPGAPPLPLRANLAFDATGHYDLAAFRLDDVAGGVSVNDADLMLPEHLIAEKLHVDRIELRGRADLRAQRASLETGRVQIGALEINIADFETTLGAHIESRWRIDITGFKGSALRPLLPAGIRTLLPISAEAIDLIAMNRASTHGVATLSHDAAGVWSSHMMQAEGRLDFALGKEPFAITWSARQPEGGDALVVEAALPTFVPGHWPAALLEGTPMGAIDVPLALTAQATLSPAGVPRSARIVFTGAPGTLKPLQPNLPPLSVRRFEVRVESEEFERAWRVPIARLELANGAGAELLNTQAQRSPGQIAVQGEARASGLPGDFIALWLPPGTWAPLTTAGIEPRDVSLARVGVHFNATVAEQAGGDWQAKALTADAEAQLRLHAVPLNFSLHASLPDSSQQLEATVDLAEFRPSRLGVTLVPGLTTAAADFPVSLHAVARASLKGALAGAEVQVHAGPGRLKTPPAFGDVDLALKSLSLDAGYDPAQQRATVKTLRLDAGGVRLNLTDVGTGITAPFRATGRLEVEPFALGPVLALWPASQQPELRRTVQTTLRAGEFLGAQFDWAVAYNPAAQPALEISRFHGAAHLGKIEAVHSAVPGPIALGGLNAAVDYPKASVELQDVVLPGLRLNTAHIDVSGLDSKAPVASVTAKFDTDLAAANLAWKFAQPDSFNGVAGAEISIKAPFSAETIDAQVRLDFTRAKFSPRGFPDAAPDTLNVTAKVTNALSAGIATAEFSLNAGKWLGAPLHAAGRATLAAGDHHPTLLESTYDHGGTHLQAKFSQPGETHRDLSLTGSSLELGLLMRAGIAAADAFAGPPAKPGAAPAKKPAAVTPPPAAAPAAPMSVNLDVQVDRVVFDAGETARKFELHTRLDNNWPESFTLGAVSGQGNAVRAELTGPPDRQTFKLSIGDAAGWLRTLTSPWSAAPPAPGQFGSLVVQIMKVPALVSGGSITAEAEMRRGQDPWLQGHFELSRATLVRAPRIVQMLAGKTGKTLQASPFIESFSVGEISIGQSELRVGNIALVGTGLIDRVKVKSATYGLVNDKLFIDGEYFGVGFDFHGGTLANPGLPWLKDDNKVIQLIGVKNEFDFDDPPPAPKPKAKK